jgi:zinc protease
LALHRETIREVLPNGLTLLIRRDRTAPAVAIVTWVRAGYFDEADDEVGIAHVLEHMFFKGTPTRGVGTMARETKAHGGSLNAHTIYDHTSYYTVLPASAFVAGLELQYDAYARSLIDADELRRELEVIIEEAKRKRDTPSAVTIETLYALLHDRHRIRRWRIGEADQLRGFTQDQLLAFYRRWYCPDNTILSVVGDVDPAMVLREVAARHGTLPAGQPSRDRGPLETDRPGRRFRAWQGDIAHPHLAFGWRVPPQNHPDSAALDLAAMALGTGRASRLYRQVREKQLVTSVSAWNYTSDAVGVFTVHAEAPTATLREAARAIWREVRRVVTEGVTDRELHRARRILEARWLRRLESMEGQAQYLASWEADGGLEAGEAYYDRLMSLGTDTVQAAATRWLDPGQVSVVSYLPTHAPPLADSPAALFSWLESPLVENPPLENPRLDNPPLENPWLEPTPLESPRSASVTVIRDTSLFRTTHGVPVLVVPKPDMPLVHLGYFQSGGVTDEAPGQEGIARLTAQLTLKGTARFDARALAEASEELGGGIGVSAGTESLGWSLSVPPAYTTQALALLAEVIQTPVFPDDALDTERTLALAELSRIRDDMYRWPLRLALQSAYGTHPYGRSVLGTEASLPRLTAEDLARFHAEYVLRGNGVFAVVGPVDPASIARIIDRLFDQLHHVPGAGVAEPAWPATTEAAADHRARQQTALALLFPGIGRRDPRRHAAEVLTAIASGLGGRLFETLRDQQSLAYTVQAYPMMRSVGGAFAAYIATSPGREAEAREGLVRELGRLAEQPPTPAEMHRAQQYLIGGRAIAQQSGGTILGELIDTWLFGDGVAERHTVDAALAAVTAAEVAALARDLFHPALAVEGIVRGTAAPSSPAAGT